MKKGYILLIFVLFIIFSNKNNISADQIDELIKGSFEESEKTLFILNKIFQEKESFYIERISTIDFIKSQRYKLLKDYSRSTSINFNHRKEICKKEFILNNDEKSVLLIIFEKNRELNIWQILDSYCYINGQKKEDIFKGKGFSPLSITKNFQELISIINTPEVSEYLGLAKFGKLNLDFLKRNKLSLSKNSELIIKDIIIYNDGIIKDIIYISLKYYPIGRKENNKYKGGWLINDSGSMSDYYYKNNLYIDFLLKRLNPKSLDLSKPNDFFYTLNLNDFVESQNNKRKLFSLNVITNVHKPKIRIMNIKPKFRQGILLASGIYDIEVSKVGYKTERKLITVDNSNTTININLKK